MPTAVRMPRLGMSMEEGAVVAWSCAVGEPVTRGEILLTIESEKSEVEIEATASGVLRHIFVELDDPVPCGTLLAAVTETADEAFDSAEFEMREGGAAEPSVSSPAAAFVAPPRARAAPAVDAAGTDATRRPPPVAPAARAVARDLGVDPTEVPGSGPRGRVTVADVRSWAERATRRFRDILKLSMKRRTVIRNVIRSKAEAPHFYLQVDVRMDAVQRLRERLNAEPRDGRRLTVTHLILKASALALERFPEVNAVYRPDERDIALHAGVHIALAVDADGELLAPVVKDCGGRSVFELAEQADALIERARLGTLTPEDHADGTFTISNLGMFGVDRFYAIITPPQAAILSVGAVQRRPIAEGEKVAVATVASLGLSVDHRVLDGVRGARFLGELKRLLEHPDELVQGSEAGRPTAETSGPR